jgi:hypothetical protein
MDIPDHPRTRFQPEPSTGSSLLPWVKLGAVLSVFALAAVGVAAYLLLRPDCEIYVDNGGSEPITVSLDGSSEITVAKGQVEKIPCRAGSHHITVWRGGKVVFDETRELTKASRGKNKYILNPEKSNRYWQRTVQYGIGIPNFSFYINDLDRYHKIAAQVSLLTPGEFFEVSADHVLEPAPKTVKGKFMDSRKVVARVSRSDYDLIAGAEKKQSVTSEEISRLERVVDRLLDIRSE